MKQKSPPIEITEPVSDALAWVANHDVKAITYPLLHELGSSTRTELASHIVDVSGLPEVYDFVRSYPDTYVLGGFAVKHTGDRLHRGQPVNEFVTVRPEPGLAVVGELLEWSDEHDIPVMDVLSFTPSKGSRAPGNSIQIFDTLLRGRSIGEIGGTTYKPSPEGWGTAHNTRLKKLVEKGFVIVEDPEIRLRILDPTPKSTRTLRQSSQDVYSVLSRAQEISPDYEWSIDELLRLASLAGITDSEEGSRALRAGLVMASSASSPRNFRGAVEKQPPAERRYRLSPIYEEAVSDLVERVVRLSADEEFGPSIDKAMDRAHDAPSVGRIIKRGADSTPYSKRRGA